MWVKSDPCGNEKGEIHAYRAVPIVYDIYAHMFKHIHVCAYFNVALAMRSPRPPRSLDS